MNAIETTVFLKLLFSLAKSVLVTQEIAGSRQKSSGFWALICLAWVAARQSQCAQPI
jgi:hypothetical protein